ncbi:MAG: hypothetical protein ABWZ77_05850 [Naasia sp.]
MTLRARPDDQKSLLDVQAFDNRSGHLAKERRTLPQIAALEVLSREAEVLRRRSIEVRGALEDAQAELSRVHSDVVVVDARISRDQTRLAMVTSAKDAQGLEHELASLAGRKSNLEDIELGVMERVEEHEAALSLVQREQAELQAAVAETEAARDARAAEIESELAELTEKRLDLVALIPEDLMALYERQRSRYGVGAALLRRGVSGGSNMALTGSDLAKIRAAAPDEVVLDPESGCILVRTDESGLEPAPPRDT